jgi:hypothetical protein
MVLGKIYFTIDLNNLYSVTAQSSRLIYIHQWNNASLLYISQQHAHVWCRTMIHSLLWSVSVSRHHSIYHTPLSSSRTMICQPIHTYKFKTTLFYQLLFMGYLLYIDSLYINHLSFQDMHSSIKNTPSSITTYFCNPLAHHPYISAERYIVSIS